MPKKQVASTEATGRKKLITAREAADRICCHPQSLYSKHYRKKIGLRGVKIGGSLRFFEQDVDHVIESGIEVFPEGDELMEELRRD